MNHYTEEELAQEPLPANVEQHAAECEECGETLAFIRTFDEALREELPWQIAAELKAKPPLPPSLKAVAERLETERAAAMALLAPLVASPATFTPAGIDSDPAFQNTGVLRVLAELAQSQRQRQPQFALLLAETAIAIGTTLQERGELRSTSWLGDAWKEKAIALGTIGRYRDAEDAARRAEAAYRSDPRATDHDLAIAWQIRATICSETERFDEARELAAAAAAKFLEFGDTSRYMSAELLQGDVLFYQRAYRDAASLFMGVVSTGRAIGDKLLLARALHALGSALTADRHPADAVPVYHEALTLWDELGFETERVRTKWALASSLIAAGNFADGIEQLERARREFHVLGVINDAALVTLELAEALLAVDRHEEVPALLKGVAVSFTSEGMMRNAQMALAYLREAVGRADYDVDLVRGVREYLETLPAHPTQAFTAPRRQDRTV